MKISYKKLWVMLIEREIPEGGFSERNRAFAGYHEQA